MSDLLDSKESLLSTQSLLDSEELSLAASTSSVDRLPNQQASATFDVVQKSITVG
jgi:hypothetical protein